MTRMTAQNGSPLSLGPSPSGRLKNLRNIGNAVRGMSVTRRLKLFLFCSLIGSNIV